MALNEVKFTTTAGGLGRLPEGEDHVSGIFVPLAGSPANWANPLGKKYLSLEEAEADGIIESSPNYAIMWYQIREFFRVAGATTLYVVNQSHANFSAQNVYALTEGKLRQVFWYAAVDYTGLAAHVSVCETFAVAMEILYAPLVIVTNVKDEATTVDGTQVDLRALNSKNVAVLIAGDGSGKGKLIAASLGIKYIANGGVVIAAMAKGQVHHSIAWVDRYNLANAVELQKAVFSDGKSFDEVPASVLDSLNTKGYLFFRKFPGLSGTYLNDSHTSTVITSDYATLENNRTIQKAKRNIRVALLPDLNSPLTVDDDGKLSPSTIKYFENKANRPLDRMQAAGEISGYKVTIDPNQNVLATSKLIIQVKIQPRGVARNIEVTIGYTVNL